MRSLLAATAVLAVIGATSPSLARDYPICARLATNDFNPTCDFDTIQQCRATVSGIGGDCFRNPAFAYGRSSAYSPQPRLRGKAARAAAAREQEQSWDNGGWDWNRRW